jgi:hypothetical protein
VHEGDEGDRAQIGPYVLSPLMTNAGPPPGVGALVEKRAIVFLESGAPHDAVELLGRTFADVVCICPTHEAKGLKAVLREAGATKVQVVAVNEALTPYSLPEETAAELARQLMDALAARLTSLFDSIQDKRLRIHARSFAVALESNLYSHVFTPLLVVSSWMETRSDAVVVVKGHSQQAFPWAEAVGAQARGRPTWALRLPEEADASPAAATRPASLRAAPSLEATTEEDRRALGALVLKLAEDEGTFVEHCRREAQGWPRCGMLIAPSLDALGLGSANLLRELCRLRPIAAVTLGLSEAQTSAQTAQTITDDAPPSRFRIFNVTAPGDRYRAEGDFLASYVVRQLGSCANWAPFGVDLTEAAASMIERTAKSLYPAHIAIIPRARALLRSYCPDFVCAYPGADLAARVLVGAAREIGIPTFDVQSIFISGHPRVRAHWSDTADYIMAMDSGFAKTLIETMGWRADHVIVTGSPRLDAAVQSKLDLDKPVARRRFPQLREGAHVVSYFTQFSQRDTSLNAVATLASAAADIPGLEIAIKLHPRLQAHEVAQIEDFVANLSQEVRCFVLKSGNSYDLIRASDVVVTHYSNIALEAAVLQRPVMLFNLEREFLPPPMNIGEWGIGAPVLDAKTARVLLKGFIDRPNAAARRALGNQARYFERNPQYVGMNAARMIADAVKARI